MWIRQSISLDPYEKDWVKMDRIVHDHKVFLSASSGFSLFDFVVFCVLINYTLTTQWQKRYHYTFSDNQVCDIRNLGILQFAPISIILILLSCFCMCHLSLHLNPTFLTTHRKSRSLKGSFFIIMYLYINLNYHLDINITTFLFSFPFFYYVYIQEFI